MYSAQSPPLSDQAQQAPNDCAAAGFALQLAAGVRTPVPRMLTQKRLVLAALHRW
jgi:hypothetical protein